MALLYCFLRSFGFLLSCLFPLAKKWVFRKRLHFNHTVWWDHNDEFKERSESHPRTFWGKLRQQTKQLKSFCASDALHHFFDLFLYVEEIIIFGLLSRRKKKHEKQKFELEKLISFASLLLLLAREKKDKNFSLLTVSGSVATRGSERSYNSVNKQIETSANSY